MEILQNNTHEFHTLNGLNTWDGNSSQIHLPRIHLFNLGNSHFHT